MINDYKFPASNYPFREQKIFYVKFIVFHTEILEMDFKLKITFGNPVLIDSTEHCDSLLALLGRISSDENAIGMNQITNGRSFSKEFRIR